MSPSSEFDAGSWGEEGGTDDEMAREAQFCQQHFCTSLER